MVGQRKSPSQRINNVLFVLSIVDSSYLLKGGTSSETLRDGGLKLGTLKIEGGLNRVFITGREYRCIARLGLKVKCNM